MPSQPGADISKGAVERIAHALPRCHLHCLCRGDVLRLTSPLKVQRQAPADEALLLCLLHAASVTAVATRSSERAHQPPHLCCTVLCVPPRCCWRHTSQMGSCLGEHPAGSALDLRADTCLLQAPVLVVEVLGVSHALLSATCCAYAGGGPQQVWCGGDGWAGGGGEICGEAKGALAGCPNSHTVEHGCPAQGLPAVTTCLCASWSLSDRLPALPRRMLQQGACWAPPRRRQVCSSLRRLRALAPVR